MAQEYPSLNDIAPSWADIVTTMSITGGEILDMFDFSALDWDDSVEIGEQRGASGGRVMKRTVGNQKLNAKATLYRSGHRKLVRALAAVAPKRGNVARIALCHFDILVQHTPPGETDIYKVKLKGCRLLGRAGKYAEGPDADQVEITLNPIEIVEIENGVEIALL